MKAWLVRGRESSAATIVFAETRGKARSVAMHTETCEDVDFCDIDVTRKRHMDKYYSEGKKEMDWYNAKDRIAMVKDCGFRCDYDYFNFDIEDCEVCPAKEYCDTYKGHMEMEEEQG